LELLAGAPECAAEDYFLDEIRHMVYAGDTALHVAAACYDADVVRALVDAGASVSAANRRGAQPLHYAVDALPGSRRWDPVAQRETVALLLAARADPNAIDKNGTSPLHRAVRNRCAAAVEELLAGGADPQLKNGRGSTAIDLTKWTTGRSGSGSPAAKKQLDEIKRLLAENPDRKR
jgi:ankyrin repeat protein